MGLAAMIGGGVLVAMLLACATDRDPGCRAEGRHLLIATVDAIAGVGALSTSSLDGTCVDDAIATVGPDPFVRSLGDLVVAADRTGGDAIRVFEAGAYETPVAEFAIGRGSNVHDVARAGDRLVLAPYDEAALVVTDLRGERLGAIDLSAYADEDGIPEVDRVVEAGGELYAAVQRLDRGQSPWGLTGPGLLVPVDPAALDAGAAVEVGPNPKILPDPTDPDAVVIATGRFYVADGEAQRWAGGAGVTALASEDELQLDLTHVLPVGDGAVLLGIDLLTDGPSHLVCLDAEGNSSRAAVEGWLVDGVTDGAEVWVALREQWNGAVEGALLRVDPATCTTELLVDGFRLDPYSIALVDGL